MNEISFLFKKCLDANYTRVGRNADYAVQIDGDTLYLLFEWSSGKYDWLSNFDFPVRAYSDMEEKWHCHRGFLKVWKDIRPHLEGVVMDEKIKRVFVVGYSHGGAIAALAHEYVWFKRPDLRNSLKGYGFGTPRCFWGLMKKTLKKRWEDFHPVRNANDLITRLPPAWMGFRHVNEILEIGDKDDYTFNWKNLKDGKITKALPCVHAHYPEEYLRNSRWSVYEDIKTALEQGIEYERQKNEK